MSNVLNPIMYSVMISAKAFTVTDKCIGCGKCAERCPLNNVTLSDGKPVRGKNCTHCMACIAGCPQEAVECGKKIRGKPDMEQRRVRLSAHQPRHGQPYPECADNSLNQNKFRAAAAVEITDKAEQERGQKAIPQGRAFGARSDFFAQSLQHMRKLLQSPIPLKMLPTSSSTQPLRWLVLR